MSITPYSLRFTPLLKERVWGGRELATLGKTLPPNVRIGESWEIADLPPSVPAGRSVIANGPLTGRTLHELLAEDRSMVLGAARPGPDGGFPLLIKYLDARENLSVQVHPDEAYVRRHPGARLKSEWWYIVDAQPGAVVYRGLDPEVTRARLEADLRAGRIFDDLIALPVRSGDAVELPAGVCHALGAGVVAAEIQTPSDTTFRLYDWGRTGRELHVEQALQCVHFGPWSGNRRRDAQVDQTGRPGQPMETDSALTEPLVATEYFEVERVSVREGRRLAIVTNGLPIIWMMLRGAARVDAPGAPSTSLRRGDTVLHPAALDGAAATFYGPATLLQVAPPTPLRGLIA